uniref:Uncharacterized protein n=1 Tax=Anguilla anguilla TaxID=7936 RepID=A0A0E9RQX9_ANGAN
MGDFGPLTCHLTEVQTATRSYLLLVSPPCPLLTVVQTLKPFRGLQRVRFTPRF